MPGLIEGKRIARAPVWSASASMIRARAAAMVGFSASASRSAVERSIGYSPGGGGIKGGDGTGTFRSSCLVSGFSACVASAAAVGLAWEGFWVAVEVRATAGSGPSRSQQVTGAASGPPGTVLFEAFESFAPSRSRKRRGLGPCRDRARSSLSIDERVVSLRQCSRASTFLLQ